MNTTCRNSFLLYLETLSQTYNEKISRLTDLVNLGFGDFLPVLDKAMDTRDKSLLVSSPAGESHTPAYF